MNVSHHPAGGKTGALDAAEVRRRLTDIPALLRRLSLDEGARREGGGFKVRCPWHTDRAPSCSLTLGPDGTLRAHCFACGAGGDALSLIAAARGLDPGREFHQVLTAAAELAGLPFLDVPPAPPAPPAPPRPAPDVDEFDRLAVSLLKFCPLRAQMDVCAYVERRGILDEVAQRWGALPASPRELARVRDTLVKECGATAWERSGLAHPSRPDRVFAWPEHRLIIPWRAAGGAGVITTLQRRLVRSLKEGEDLPRYVFPRGRKPAWPYGAEDAAELGGDGVEVAYVEGPFDAHALALLSRRAGRDRLVVGLPGVSDWRPEWASLARGRVAVVALDPDRAGEDQVHRVGHDVLQAGALKVLRATPERAGDWTDQLRRAA